MKNIKLLIIGLLLLVGESSLPTLAQDNYDPVNPPEPLTLYNIKTVVEPADAGSVSGRGQYRGGTSVYINTNANSGFVFQHWLKNGVVTDKPRSFYYSVEDFDATWTAMYVYSPNDPSEPSGIYANHLWLTTNLEGSCSFNRTSGAKVNPDTYVQVRAYPSQGFVFNGWWQGAEKVSDSESFNFLMPNGDTTLEARYIYSPTNPGEPTGSSSGVENTAPGDIDADGTIDVTDAVALLNAYLNGETGDMNPNVADVNNDGSIDVTDAVEILNIYLNNQ